MRGVHVDARFGILGLGLDFGRQVGEHAARFVLLVLGLVDEASRMRLRLKNSQGLIFRKRVRALLELKGVAELQIAVSV